MKVGVRKRNGDGTFYPFVEETVPENFVMKKAALDGVMFFSPNLGLSVIVTGETREGKNWIHCSFARKGRMPDYADTQRVRKAFIGEDLKSIMIWPEKSKYVNIHSYCLHLFACLDGDGLPEFSGVVGGVHTL